MTNPYDSEPLVAKPTLLIFIEHYLPGYKFGGPIRSVANLVPLLRAHYRLSIVTRDRDWGDSTPYAGIPIDEWLPREGYRIRYVSPRRASLRGMHALLREHRYDYVYTNSLFALFTRQLLLLSMLTGQRIVIAPRGELHPGALGLKRYKKRPFVWLTRLLPNDRIVWHATDPDELRAIQQHFGNGRVRYAPVRFAPDTPSRLTQRTEHRKQAGEARFVFISRITPKKGVRFLLERLLQHTGGRVVLDIFGPVVDVAYWRECEGLLARTPARCQVRYPGMIRPENVADTVKQYDFFVLPTLGENFGHAIFEALSAGLPVLISDQTPWRNLAAQQAGWDLPLNEAAWSDALTQCVDMDAQTYARWSGQARGVADAYMRAGQFERSYLDLFSTSSPYDRT